MKKIWSGEKKDTITFVAVGDVFLSGKVVYQDGTFKEVSTYKPESVFESVAPIFQNADVVFCNLETSLSDRGAPQGGSISSFISRPENISFLREAGVDVVSVANNHSMDFGSKAMLETLELLDQHSIAHAGGGVNIIEARRPALIERENIVLAFLAYTTNTNVPKRFLAGPQDPGLVPLRLSPYFPPPHVNREDLRAMQLDIKKAKQDADAVIVSCHWGVSGGGTFTVAVHQKGIGHAAIRAGADLVLGHHQHAYQGIEIYQGKIICHGLGNFIFDFHRSPSCSHIYRKGVLFHCTFKKDVVEEAWLQPIIEDNHVHPRPLLPEDEISKEVLAHLQELSKELGVRLKIKDGKAIIPLDKAKK